MLKRMQQWAQQGLNALYPATCVFCGAPGQNSQDLCAGCYADLPHNRSCCRRCARPLPTSYAAASGYCDLCRRHPPPFDGCIAPLLYTSAVPFLIKSLKFHQQLAYASVLGALLVEGVMAIRDPETPWPARILPVPLHSSRLRERGFNQSQEIARILARRLVIPLDHKSSIRQRATFPQTHLDAQARRHNLRGAFAVTRPLPDFVALVDDVITTGSTVRELTRALKQSGVRHVEVWAVARTVNG